MRILIADDDMNLRKVLASELIEEEIERCKKITRGMLSLVRRSDQERHEVDVNEVLDKALDMVSFQGRLKDVEVSRSLQRRISKIRTMAN